MGRVFRLIWLKQLDISNCRPIKAMLVANSVMAITLNWASELMCQRRLDISNCQRTLIGVFKWGDCLEYGKGVSADACEASRNYKKFVECADRKQEYRWDGLGDIMVSDGMTLKASSWAESIAALFGYASEHWESCVTGG
jgi:hypothetical protein